MGVWARWAAATATLGLLAVSCGDGGEASGDGGGAAPLVLATTSIWADVVANVACDGSATVEPIVPVGVDAHSFEPSLADRGRLADAALVVANGLDLEEALADTLEAARADGTTVLTVADHVSHRSAAADHDHDHDHDEDDDDPSVGHDHDHDRDPHLWLDPQLVAEALDPLARALIDHGRLDPEAVEACASAYRQELVDLDREVEALVAEVPPEQRLLVTNHDSIGYFADRYGFDVIGTVIPSTSSLAETNPAALERLASLIDSTDVRAIFTDEAATAGDAAALARELDGVAVVPLHIESLGQPGSAASTYLDMVADDARRIVDGLTGGER